MITSWLCFHICQCYHYNNWKVQQFWPKGYTLFWHACIHAYTYYYIQPARHVQTCAIACNNFFWVVRPFIRIIRWLMSSYMPFARERKSELEGSAAGLWKFYRFSWKTVVKWNRDWKWNEHLLFPFRRSNYIAWKCVGHMFFLKSNNPLLPLIKRNR